MSIIDDYLNKLEPPQKAELERIRKIVKSVVPSVEEAISYGIPTFKYKGKYLTGFYVYKNHMSLFPTPEPINALKSQLKAYKLSKGTIQFTLDNTIPEQTIKDLVSIRMKGIDKS